jgi:hypothetical protein
MTHQFHNALQLINGGHYLVNAWHGHRWGNGQCRKTGKLQLQVSLGVYNNPSCGEAMRNAASAL